MKSSERPQLPAAAGVYRLRVAGVVDPCAAAPSSRPPEGSAEVLVELGATDPSRPEPGRPGPGWALARAVRILATGAPGELESHPGSARTTPIDLGRSVLMPAMVNAHTHLDLTHMGPQPHEPGEGFVAWVDRVRAGRVEAGAEIRASVERGVELSLRAGVVVVGDIAGAPRGVPRIEPFETLAASPLRGVSFVEFFAMGKSEEPALERVRGFLDAPTRARPQTPDRAAVPRVRLGLQPHAPNTVSLAGYRQAVELARRYGLPLSTHLAETPEERQFIAHASGPQREMLERFGVWDDAILEHVGQGRTPVEHLAGVLEAASFHGPHFLAAHANDLGPEPGRSLEILEGSWTSIGYCPRASEYFDAASHFGPHRYREMLAAGINVCLGTDSIMNLPAGADGPGGAGLSVLDEARLLYARDGTDAHTLVRMMTVNGCLGLGLPEGLCSLGEGAEPAGLVVVPVGEGDGPAAERVLGSDALPMLLAISSACAAS